MSRSSCADVGLRRSASPRALRTALGPMAVTYEWRGSGRRKGTRTFFDAMVAKVGQVEVSARVGSAVLLKAPPGELPYVALVENLYETPKGNQMMGTRWFYRVEDVPARQRPPGMLVSKNKGLAVWAAFHNGATLPSCPEPAQSEHQPRAACRAREGRTRRASIWALILRLAAGGVAGSPLPEGNALRGVAAVLPLWSAAWRAFRPRLRAHEAQAGRGRERRRGVRCNGRGGGSSCGWLAASRLETRSRGPRRSSDLEAKPTAPTAAQRRGLRPESRPQWA